MKTRRQNMNYRTMLAFLQTARRNCVVTNSSPAATQQTLQQSSYTANFPAVQLHSKLSSSPATQQTLPAVQLHSKLSSSPATQQTLQQSSYTANSPAVQLHSKPSSSPATQQTLQQSSYTANSPAVQLHSKLSSSPATQQTLQQSSYTANSIAAGRNWRRQPHSSCSPDSQCRGHR